MTRLSGTGGSGLLLLVSLSYRDSHPHRLFFYYYYFKVMQCGGEGEAEGRLERRK